MGVFLASAVPKPPGTQSSPRSWGCFSCGCKVPHDLQVFPTLVGVFRVAAPELPVSESLPHARGGVSDLIVCMSTCLSSSPRSWGCFYLRLWRNRNHNSLPHARGGVSDTPRLKGSILRSSPRSWGCFHARRSGGFPSWVFPTLVGVFLLTP